MHNSLWKVISFKNGHRVQQVFAIFQLKDTQDVGSSGSYLMSQYFSFNERSFEIEFKVNVINEDIFSDLKVFKSESQLSYFLYVWPLIHIQLICIILQSSCLKMLTSFEYTFVCEKAFLLNFFFFSFQFHNPLPGAFV